MVSLASAIRKALRTHCDARNAMPRRFVRALKKSLRSRDRSLEDEEAQDLIVWDSLNPFAPPDLEPPCLRMWKDAEIARVKRREMVAPRKWVDDDVPWASESDDDENGDHDDDNDGASSDKVNIGDDVKHDADDEGDLEDNDFDIEDEDESQNGHHSDKLSPIALPRLLPVPLRFLPSLESSSTMSSLLFSPIDNNPSVGPRAIDDTTEDEEFTTRKAKRNLLRSRSKAIAILGPEASCAF